MPAHPNLVALHRQAAERWGSATALRYRKYGLYHDLSWRDYRRQVERAAAGLIDLGIAPGDRVALLAANCWQWLAADVAILATGAADVPLHAPLSPRQVEFQLQHSGARGVFVGDQVQADKIAAVLDLLPDLEFLIAIEPVQFPPGVELITWDGLQQRGHGCGTAGRQELARREAALGHTDLATVIYTSGTTGNPKGVMLSHGNLLSNAESMIEISDTLSSDVLMSWLPYSHIYARTVDHYLTMLAGTTICLAESPDTLLTNIAEAAPTWITAVPRFYEKVWAQVAGLSPAERGRELRRLFGPRMTRLTSGGAPLPKSIAQGYIGAGFPMLEGYGLTESSPVISFNRFNSIRPGTVGRAINGVEIRIAPDGEILTRGPHVMLGYWRDEAATAAAIVDGWLHTGDVGTLDADGYLTITDRKKDLIITSGGKNIAPTELERLLTSDPYIDQAVVYGDARPFVSALIVPKADLIQAQAAALGCRLTIRDGIIECEPIHSFIAARISYLMQAVSQPEQVRAFVLLASPFQIDAGELTATFKVRRRQIVQNYQRHLEALYAE